MNLPQAYQTMMILRNLQQDEFFRIIESLSYEADEEPKETFRAPWIVLDLRRGDCDDVAILCAFWAKAHRKRWTWSLWGKKNVIKHIATRIDDFLIDPFGSYEYELLFQDQWRR